MQLPHFLKSIRPKIHLLRRILHKILGTRHELAALEPTLFEDQKGGMPVVKKILGFEGQILRLVDKLAILESQLNWRLFGLPGNICNIKLEQEQILAGSLDVEKALTQLASTFPRPSEADLQMVLPPNCAAACVVAGDAFSELNYLAQMLSPSSQIVALRDASDLLQEAIPQPNPTAKNITMLTLSAANFAARLQKPEFDFCWISGIAERMTPIQSQIFLNRSFQALKTSGVLAGFFTDYSTTDVGTYWLDARRLRPVTRSAVEQMARLAGFSEICFNCQDNGITLFSCKRSA